MRKLTWVVLSLILACAAVISVSASTATVTLPVSAYFPTFLSLTLERVTGSPASPETAIGPGTEVYNEPLVFDGSGRVPGATTYLVSEQYQTTVVCNATWGMTVNLSDAALTSGPSALPVEWQSNLGGGFGGFSPMAALNAVYAGQTRTTGTNSLFQFRVNYSPIYEAGTYTGTISFVASTP